MKALKITAWIGVVAILLYTGMIIALSAQKVGANPSIPTVTYMPVGGGSESFSAIATTTPNITFTTTSSASTTFPILSASADQIDVTVQLLASTSATALVISKQVSDGSLCNSAPLGCDWADVPLTTAGTNVTNYTLAASSTASLIWKPDVGTLATSTANFTFTGTNHGYTRFRFQVIGADGGIWVKTTKKVQAR